MTCPRPDDPQWPTQAAARDVIAAEVCGLCRGKGTYLPHCFRCEDSTDDHECPDTVACNHDAGYRRADQIIAALGATGYHITHDPTPTQKAARIRKRRHLGSWSGWPRRSPR